MNNALAWTAGIAFVVGVFQLVAVNNSRLLNIWYALCLAKGSKEFFRKWTLMSGIALIIGSMLIWWFNR